MSEVIINEKPATDLSTADFTYDLPEEQIAQHPVEPRDSSRLLVVDRATGELEHKHFYDIIDYLNPGDTLVINDSKVIPARLYGHPESRPDALCELLLLRQRGNDVWETLVKPGKRARIGARIVFGEGKMTAVVTDIVEEGNRLVQLEYDHAAYANVYDMLNEIGMMPLPPYITERLEDQSRYQTVYAREEGSAAAPTAGLHFTKELLERIREKGIAVVPVMLHVGLGTFRPVKEDNILEHKMHVEHIILTKESADAINEVKKNGGRVIAVGTTSCRLLESCANDDGTVTPCDGETGIFIYPSYKFKVMDGLITNFHLPESTLIMLVSAFAGYEHTMNAYKEAVKERYRFFSFGDAMIIL